MNRLYVRIFLAVLLSAICGACAADELWVTATQTVEVVEHHDYTLGYWEDMELSAWVVEQLTPAMFKKNCERDSGFRKDTLVSTGSALSSDYTNTGYDRGHLAPAADFAYDETAMYESFFMSNIAPQVPNLNRGAWAKLEDWTRDCVVDFAQGLTVTQAMIVITGPVITGAVERIGKNNVAVPHGFFKALYDQRREKMVAFLYDNAAGESSTVSDHLVSVDEIERLTGLDLFALLPDAQVSELESTTDWKGWFNLSEQKSSGFMILIL